MPTALIEKQVKENGVHITWVKYNNRIEYPQVRRLASKDVENKINNHIKLIVEIAENGCFGAGGRADAYKVTENKNNRLEISFTVSGYTDDDIGYYFSHDLKLVYDLTTGKEIS